VVATMRFPVIASVVLCFGALPTFAQFLSAVEGTVMDPQKAVIPNVTLTLRNVDTGISATTTTSSTGYYRFPSLPAANFKLSAVAAGFKTTELAPTVNCANLATGPATVINTPIGSLPCNMNVTGQANFTITPPRKGLQYNTRVDHAFSSKDRIFGAIFRNDLKTVGGSVRPAFRNETIATSARFPASASPTSPDSATAVRPFSCRTTTSGTIR